LIRSTATVEPEYDDEQRNLMIAYSAYLRDIGPHGEPMSEATSDLADPTNYSPAGWRYEAKVVATDWAEKARQEALEELRKADTKMHGLIVGVKKVSRGGA
jgi:hypothetical protein